MLTLLFDGVAYGMLLFVLAIGLSITLGLMNFINLAHGAFAMAGGYTLVLLMQKAGWPFLVCVLMAFAVSALLGLVLEATLYRRMYQKPHLDQVLFSIGLTFMAVAAVDYFVGSTQQLVQLPEFLKGRTELWDGALGMGHYRLAIIAVCALLALGLQWLLVHTRFGAQLRASVDDRRVAAGMGINVKLLSTHASDRSTPDPPAPVMMTIFSPLGVGRIGTPRAKSSKSRKLRARITPICLNTSS